MQTPNPSGKFAALTIAACVMLSLPAHAVLVTHLDFETGTGSPVDLAPANGGDNSATLLGNAAYSGNVPGALAGLSNFSLSLDGTGDYATLANQGGLLRNVQGFTLSVFVNVTAFPAGGSFDSVIFLSNGSAVSQSRAAIQVGSNGQIAVGGRRADGDSFSRYGSAGGLITTGTWSHIAATVDFSSGSPVINLYHNGAPVGHSVLSNGFSLGTATSDTDSLIATVGAQGTGTAEFFHGFLDDARVYNHVLSANEIAAIAVPEPSAPLMALAGLGMALAARRRRKAVFRAA